MSQQMDSELERRIEEKFGAKAAVLIMAPILTAYLLILLGYFAFGGSLLHFVLLAVGAGLAENLIGRWIKKHGSNRKWVRLISYSFMTFFGVALVGSMTSLDTTLVVWIALVLAARNLISGTIGSIYRWWLLK